MHSKWRQNIHCSAHRIQNFMPLANEWGKMCSMFGIRDSSKWMNIGNVPAVFVLRASQANIDTLSIFVFIRCRIYNRVHDVCRPYSAYNCTSTLHTTMQKETCVRHDEILILQWHYRPTSPPNALSTLAQCSHNVYAYCGCFAMRFYIAGMLICFVYWLKKIIILINFNFVINDPLVFYSYWHRNPIFSRKIPFSTHSIVWKSLGWNKTNVFAIEWAAKPFFLFFFFKKSRRIIFRPTVTHSRRVNDMRYCRLPQIVVKVQFQSSVLQKR